VNHYGEINKEDLNEFQRVREKENNKCFNSFDDGDVDKSDINTILFEIFSKRKKFTYNLKERSRLYLGFLGKAYNFCRCRIF